jgi:hypothetical protein
MQQFFCAQGFQPHQWRLDIERALKGAAHPCFALNADLSPPGMPRLAGCTLVGFVAYEEVQQAIQTAQGGKQAKMLFSNARRVSPDYGTICIVGRAIRQRYARGGRHDISR